MENFNLKKFLVENKLTTNSRMLNEGITNIAQDITDAFLDARIDMKAPTQVVVVDYLGTIEDLEQFNTGHQALSYIHREALKYYRGEEPEIRFENEIEPHDDLEKQPKLEFEFEDPDDETHLWAIGVIQ
jgi:hypothetical protein